MKAKDKKALEIVGNYVAKAIFKSMEIESTDWKVQKVNAELTKIAYLIDEINEQAE